MPKKFSLFDKLHPTYKIHHHNIPIPNLYSTDKYDAIAENLEDKETFLEGLNENVEYLYPPQKRFRYETDLCTALLAGSSSIDRTHQLVKDKKLWRRTLKKLTPKDCDNAEIQIKALMKKRTQVRDIDPKVLNYLSHIAKDPEPSFTGEYNWLYTGGSISVTEFDGMYLVFAGNQVRDQAALSILQLDKDFKTTVREFVHKLKYNSPVLQVISQIKEDGVLVVVRQKERINLLLVKDYDNVEELWFEEDTENDILVSCSLNGDSEKLACVNSYSHCEVYNTQSGSILFFQRGNFCKSGHWQKVELSESGDQLQFCDHSTYKIFDLRAKPVKESFLYELGEKLNVCESVSDFIVNRYDPNVVFFGATHTLLEFDIRNKQFSQVWGHLMKSPPQFGRIIRRQEDELILIQSRNVDEIIGVLNERTGNGLMVSQSAPYAFYTAKEALRKAQYNGICLTPGITSRFNYTVCGLDVHKDSQDNINVLTVNGGGDVFKMKLKERRDEGGLDTSRWEEEGVFDDLRKYEDHFNEINSVESIQATYIVDMNCIVNAITDQTHPGLKSKKPKKGIYWRNSEMYSPKSLCIFKDFLADKILRVWGYETRDDYESDEEKPADKLLSDEFAKKKVEEWIRRNH